MNESTDLEICQRIAKIEGVKVRKCDGVICILEATGSSLMKIPTTEYNPLTDDALCFKLMVKHEISIINISEGLFMVQCKMITVDTSDSVNIKKAICLAIIKSKE
jgi:hypothetical protein